VLPDARKQQKAEQQREARARPVPCTLALQIEASQVIAQPSLVGDVLQGYLNQR
jgi:hypothetical protein